MTLTALDTAIADASRDAVAGGFTLRLRLGWRLYAEACFYCWASCFKICKGMHTAKGYYGHAITLDDHLAPDDFLIEGLKQ
jgi:hypothetical protein